MPKHSPNLADGCHEFRSLAELSRRQVLQAGSIGALGLGMTGLWNGRSAAAAEVASSLARQPGFGRAKACILIFVWGGPSQLDTWDPKPNAPADIRGEFKPISTNVPGIQISEHFPLLAKHADKYTIIRSMTHNDPAHLSSVHHLMTGRHAIKVKSDADPPSRRDWPHVGSMLAKMRPQQGVLPPFVMMPWYVNHPAAPGGTAPGQNAGQLGAGYDPFVVAGDPNAADFGVTGLGLPSDISLERMQSRQSLLSSIDAQSRALAAVAEARSFNDLQNRAISLVTSTEARAAFDLNKETPETRERYSRHLHGQSLLLARRLVEAGVSLVCVNWHNDHANFWDTHGDNFNQLKNRLMPPADRGFAALLEDLTQRGMLDETLVVWTGEFGRNPQVKNAGREHWPHCYSAVMAGGGVRGGKLYGSSNARAEYPDSDPVSPADLCATVYHALGVPADQMVNDRENRPIRLTEGMPLTPLFG